MRSAFHHVIRSSLKTSLWLLSIMIPISFGVTLLQYFGILSHIAGWLEPFCRIVGLRGEAALVWLTAGTLNLYSGIAVIQSIPFTVREITIMALMTLIAHSLIVETIVQRKTGSSALLMLGIRIGVAFLGGLILHAVLPENNTAQLHGIAIATPSFGETMAHWGSGTCMLALKIICIILSLNILQKFMQDYGLMDQLARLCSPVMRFMGLTPATSFLWIVANTVGLSYGAAIILENRHQLLQRDTDLLNCHIAVCHSFLEDTPMFLAVNAQLFWITVPRVLLAILTVWIYRLLTAKTGSGRNVPDQTGPDSTVPDKA